MNVAFSIISAPMSAPINPPKTSAREAQDVHRSPLAPSWKKMPIQQLRKHLPAAPRCIRLETATM